MANDKLGGPITDEFLKEVLEESVRDLDERNSVQGEEWRYADQEPLAAEAAVAAMRRAFDFGRRVFEKPPIGVPACGCVIFHRADCPYNPDN